MKRLWLICFLSTLAAGLAFGGAGIVSAQESEKEKDEFLLEDIVVTANRVESLASKTPISITAVSGETMVQTGLLDPTMLEEMVPGLSIVDTGSNRGLQITIRGVTSSDNTEKGDASAAFMIDDIYFGRQLSHDINFFDIERVEVLRGPQGTLYGRNTPAGVVNVITNKPSHVSESSFNATIGNEGTYLGDVMLNVPVNDKLALRGGFLFKLRDNYINTPNAFKSTSPLNNDYGLRLQALYDINEDISLLVKAESTSRKGHGWSSSTTTDFSMLYDTSDAENPVYLGGLTNDEILTDMTLSAQRNDQKIETKGITARLDWDLGPAAFTYLGAYHDISQAVYGGYGGGDGVTPAEPLDFMGDYWQTQHEARIATTGDGPFQGQMGIYYFYETSGIAFILYNFLGIFEKFGWPQDPTISESYAVYGQGTYSLLPNLRLTAGLRYSHDFKSRKGFTYSKTFGGVESFGVNDAEITFTKTNFRVGLDYDLTDDTLLYGSIATGYKAGGFNDGCLSTTPGCNQVFFSDDLFFYEPENITAYEIGVKTKYSDKLVLNSSAFYYDYSDLQLTTVIEMEGGGGMTYTSNAAKAEVQGLEIESVFMPAVNHRIDATVAWLDASYKEYIARNFDDWSGRSLDRSPDFTFTLGYRYRYPLENGGDIETSIRFRWSDDYVISTLNTPAQYPLPSYHKTDVSVTYTSPEGKFYIQVFGKNLEDEITLHGFFGTSVRPMEPLTYGIRTGLRF